MTRAPVRVMPFGDAAVLIVLGDAIDPALSARVHRLAAAIHASAAGEAGWGRPVPAYASVLVPVDPIEPGVEHAVERLGAIATEADEAPLEIAPAAPAIELPTRYGGADGPDLEEVAAIHDLRPADVVELHGSVGYRVFFLGFAPGFAYLGPLPDAIATPRLATPRVRVPAGSVGIAGAQTGVYPFDSPGGWRIVGRTEVPVWEVRRDPPALLMPGATVRFVPIR